MVSVNTTQLCVHEHYRWNVVVTVPQHGGFRFNVQGSGWGMGRTLGESPGVTCTGGCTLHIWVTPSDPRITSKKVKTSSSVFICRWRLGEDTDRARGGRWCQHETSTPWSANNCNTDYLRAYNKHSYCYLCNMNTTLHHCTPTLHTFGLATHGEDNSTLLHQITTLW